MAVKEALVIGGGPAGASLAALLSRAGREVMLIEREPAAADKVCGEFLSREAVRYLTAAGVALPALGAVPIDSVHLVIGARVASARLPFPALSLSRAALDEALLGCAADAGCDVRRGSAVRRLVRSGERWIAWLGDGSAVQAKAAFIATGKHDLRGWKRPRGLQSDLVAFKLHWVLQPEQVAELSRKVELVLFRGGYAGLEPIESGRANLCLVVRKSRLAEAGRWHDLLAAIRQESAHLDARLSGATPCTARPATLSAIPYGYVRTGGDGPFRLGDQAAVMPSFAGDGMSIALHSARLAAATYLSGGGSHEYQRIIAHDIRWQVMLATCLSLCLVRRPAQLALSAAARLFPVLMRTIARSTRVTDAALERAGLSPVLP